MGVVSALIKFGGIDIVNAAWFESHSAEVLGIVMFAVLCAYLVWEALRGKKED